MRWELGKWIIGAEMLIRGVERWFLTLFSGGMGHFLQGWFNFSIKKGELMIFISMIVR